MAELLGEARRGGGVVRLSMEDDAAGSSAKTDKAPGWVCVARDLVYARLREYRDETGKTPSGELLQKFQDTMRERIDQFIEHPKERPFRVMRLKEFEKSMETTSVPRE